MSSAPFFLHMGSAHLAVLEVVGPDPPSKSLREEALHHQPCSTLPSFSVARVCKDGMVIRGCTLVLRRQVLIKLVSARVWWLNARVGVFLTRMIGPKTKRQPDMQWPLVNKFNSGLRFEVIIHFGHHPALNASLGVK